MTKSTYIRPNILGDLRAEADGVMLKKAFIETADYRTLIETSDRTIVVGRRGTGKSALMSRFIHYCKSENNVVVVQVTPEEHQIIGILPQIERYGDTFTKIRAGSRLLWRYAFMLELVSQINAHHSGGNEKKPTNLLDKLREWELLGSNIVDRFCALLIQSYEKSLTPEELISKLPVYLDLTAVEDAVAEVCNETRVSVVFLIDRLDEGYEPSAVGTGFIDGLVQAAIDIKTRFPNVKPVIFLRDNIFRAVQNLDPDYSRNIEGHILRIHWDEQSLFNFVTKRLKIAFDISQEAGLKIWNQCVAGDIKGKKGFTKCLQLTLYRPRDLLSLLNEAFYKAGKDGQNEIVMDHIEYAGRTISQNRLDDLWKEYAALLPGLREYTATFNDCNPEMSYSETEILLEGTLSRGSQSSIAQQDFLILDSAKEIIRALYSIGFIGIKDPSTGSFVFCHDGRAPDREFTNTDRVLIHPCYWMALNATRNALNPDEAEEIFDEYDIEVSSETPEIRNERIKGLVEQLRNIPVGADGASEFESWCAKAIRICFAKGLRNVELKPNKQARLRRDVVATNLGEGDAWRRIYEDYNTRQVVFEIKNYEEVTSSDYHQMVTYLTGDYGKLGFIVTRGNSVDLFANRDVEWVRDVYALHQIIVIKLTGKYLAKLLNKLQKPQKHDAVNNAIHSLLDTYTRLYLSGQSKKIS